MLQITEDAKAELRRLLEASVDWPGARLRLLERSGGALGLGIDIAGESDTVVEYQGDELMVIEEDLADRLERVLLDVENTADGVVLVIDER
jgi:Fe-S cluster assembly iron-binding protein IscA